MTFSSEAGVQHGRSVTPRTHTPTGWRRMGSWGIAPHILNVGSRWRWVISFTLLMHCSRGKTSLCLLDRWLGTFKGRCSRCKEKNSCSFCSLIIILTELLLARVHLNAQETTLKNAHIFAFIELKQLNTVWYSGRNAIRTETSLLQQWYTSQPTCIGQENGAVEQEDEGKERRMEKGDDVDHEGGECDGRESK